MSCGDVSRPNFLDSSKPPSGGPESMGASQGAAPTKAPDQLASATGPTALGPEQQPQGLRSLGVG